jgi:CBS domain-containing protein
MKAKDILKKKGPEVFTIGEDKSLFEAQRILITNNIGVLMVLNQDGKIVGIMSERDILRESYNSPDNYKDIPVKDIMSKNVIVIEPEDDIEYIESIMTEKRIRHLPVVQNKVLVGLISIGDIVKGMYGSNQAEIKYLRDYISGDLPM